MKPAALHPLLAIATVALMQLGLLMAVFAGLHKLGIVVASAGLVTAGAWALARYLAWEAHE